MPAIHGYRLDDPSLPASPLSATDLAELKGSLLLGPDDLAALRRAHDIVADQVEAILDVWYGFVGGNDFLLASFVGPDGPRGEYLARVRARFGRWIADTCRAEYDATWLAYQQKIGFGHLICLLQFGTLPADLTRRNLELFARKVIPRVRHLGEHALARAAE